MYMSIQSRIVMGCAPGTNTGRWGQLGCSSLYTLFCSCPVCGTEEQAGAKIPEQKPVQSRCTSGVTKCFTRLPVMVAFRAAQGL